MPHSGLYETNQRNANMLNVGYWILDIERWMIVEQVDVTYCQCSKSIVGS